MRAFLILLICCLSFPAASMAPKLNWEQATDNAVKRYGLRAEPQMVAWFHKAGVSYPPREVALLGFKHERKVELWAQDHRKVWRNIHSYPLTAFSGRLGPKLRENDGQIPEGIYRLTNFNPFSSMHLSMMINYPNSFDKKKGIMDGRKQLGNNIFIHGKNFSVGCLAVGDIAIAQLFTLARRIGLNHIQIIIAPNDLRYNKPATTNFAQPRWLPELYQQITHSLKPFIESKHVLG